MKLKLQPRGFVFAALVGVLALVLTACAGAGATQPAGRPIEVEAVQVQIGVGSPIPVEVVVAGTWPGLCAQVERIEQQVEGSSFEISLLASPDTPDCPPDQIGLPFRIALPLNMVEMPVGTYTVAVNGVETSFEWNAQPGTSE